MLPKERPKATIEDIKRYAAEQKVELDFSDTPAYIIARRHYYSKMQKNGNYACACFVVWRENGEIKHQNFNFNTVPQKLNPKAVQGKGAATLERGVWWYKKGLHKGKEDGLRQSAPVMVYRVGVQKEGVYELKDSLNFHSGGVRSTFSEGCQTLPPSQKKEFIELVYNLIGEEKIKYVLC